MRTFLSICTWAYWTVCFHLCLVIVAIVFVLTFPFDRYRRCPNYVLKLLARLIFMGVPPWSVNIQGAEHAKIDRPTIVVANHQSFLDMPLLYMLPWRMKWVTKKSLFRIPVLGWLTAMTGHIGIERSDMRSLQRLDALAAPIKAGIPGMIFPEGTRSRTGELQPFKKGAFILAKKYDLNILPVVVQGGFYAMPPGSWKFRFKNKFTVKVLDPILAARYADANQLRSAARKTIAQELEAP